MGHYAIHIPDSAFHPDYCREDQAIEENAHNRAEIYILVMLKKEIFSHAGISF